MAKSSFLQIRLSENEKSAIKESAEKLGMTVTEYILLKCNDKKQVCNDNVISIDTRFKYKCKFYDFISEYNYLLSQYKLKISLFRNSFTPFDLEMIVDDMEFMKELGKISVLCNEKNFDLLYRNLKECLEEYNSKKLECDFCDSNFKEKTIGSVDELFENIR